MEGQMNFILMPSLQRRALVKTVITVWNQDDVRAFTADIIKSTSFIERGYKWQVVEDNVVEKVQVLPLPESLKIRLIDFVKPILLEVLHWWDCHYFSLCGILNTESLNKICWTPQGTIDRKKTAEAIIRDEKLSIQGRYKIACVYCLKNDILMLWNKIPENQRKCFYSEEDLPFLLHRLVALWTYDVKGEMNRMENITRTKHGCTPYQYAWQNAVFDCNKVATDYFWQKLTTEEREESLVKSAYVFCSYTIGFCRFSSNVDLLLFLLLQMNEEQQIKVFKKYPRSVLLSFLHWPWQGFFMKMAKHVQAFLPKDDFYFLLQLIINKVKNGFKDYDYQYLFREFWEQSPITHKEHIIVIGRHIESFSLLDLLQIKDKGNIKLILEDLATPDREKVIFSTCERLVCKDEMDSLEFFVQECLTTKDITIKFREFIKQKSLYCSKETLEKESDMWSKVSQLLDDLTQKWDNKR